MLRHIKTISIFVVVFYAFSRIPFSYSTNLVETNVMNLAPQLRCNPILDKGLEYKNKLEAFVLYKFTEDPEYFSTLADRIIEDRYRQNIFTDFAGTEIEFTKVEVQSNLMIFSMELDKVPYFLCLSGYLSGKVSILVQTRDEYFEKGTLFSNAVFVDNDTDIYVLDNTSDSYAAALSFLAKAGAFNLSKELRLRMERGEIFVSDGMAVTWDINGIVIDKNKSTKHMAWFLLDQLLLSVDPGIFPYIWKDLRKAFYDHSDAPESFDLNNYPELGDMLCEIEHDLVKSANEGDMDFHVVAYKRGIDPAIIDVRSREYVKEKIRKIFNEIAVNEAAVYSRYFKDFDVLSSSVPGSKARLNFERISERVIPVARANADGTITINDKFVDAMAFMHQKGFEHDIDNAFLDFYGSGKWPGTLNIFDSIIYSVAIHEIRGHFRYEKNRFVFNPDEKFAQGQRGLKHVYPNILSIMYFWFAICEFGYNFNEERINLFMKDYPEIFELLSMEEKAHLPRDLIKIRANFLNNNPGIGRIPGVSIPGQGIILERLWKNGESMTVDDLIEQFARTTGVVSDREYLVGNLNSLVDLGLVWVSKNRKDEPEYRRYSAIPMTTNNFNEIESIFEKSIKDPGKVKKDILAKALSEGENRWVTGLLSLVKQAAKKRAAAGAGKLVLIYDNKWVPKGQRSLKEFQALENSVIEVIEKSENVEVVKSSSEEIAGEIIKRDHVPLENFIVIAEKEVFDAPKIAAMLPRNKNDKDAIFCVAVDGEKLSDDSYVQLVEIFNIAFKAFIGNDIYRGHSAIEQVAMVLGKYYILIPRSQELGLGKIRDIYIRQIEFLHYA